MPNPALLCSTVPMTSELSNTDRFDKEGGATTEADQGLQSVESKLFYMSPEYATVRDAAAFKAIGEEKNAREEREEQDCEDAAVYEWRTDDGEVYMKRQDGYYYYMVSEKRMPYRLCANTSLFEHEIMHLGKPMWELVDLLPTVATYTSGVSGSTVKGGFSPKQKKNRLTVFHKMCKMKDTCGLTCLPDAMVTIESHLKNVDSTAAEKERVREWFREKHAGNPNQIDVIVYGQEVGLRVVHMRNTSPRILLERHRDGAFIVRLEYTHADKGTPVIDTYYMCLIDGTLIDNNSNKSPPVIEPSDWANNKAAMKLLMHYFDRAVTTCVKLTHVFMVTVSAKRKCACLDESFDYAPKTGRHVPQA